MRLRSAIQLANGQSAALAPAALSLPCVLIQPFGAGKDQREPGLVNVGDGLKQREGRILGALLDGIHVGRGAAHIGADLEVGPALRQPEFSDDSPERLRGSVTATL